MITAQYVDWRNEWRDWTEPELEVSQWNCQLPTSRTSQICSFHNYVLL